MGELAALFAASFAAATLVPLPSEAALFAYLRLHPENLAGALVAATAGNTAGGMTSYLIGRLLPQRRIEANALERLRRYGLPVLLLAWLPIVGDALCVAAGWLRMSWLGALAFMAAGRLARYLAVGLLVG